MMPKSANLLSVMILFLVGETLGHALIYSQYDFVEHQRDYIHGDLTPQPDATEKVSMKSGL